MINILTVFTFQEVQICQNILEGKKKLRNESIYRGDVCESSRDDKTLTFAENENRDLWMLIML